MKVAFYCAWPPELKGGAEFSAYRVAEALGLVIGEGNVHVINKYTTHHVIKSEEKSYLTGRITKLKYLDNIISILIIMIKLKPDVVIVHSVSVKSVYASIAKIFGAKIILSFRGSDVLQFKKESNKKKIWTKLLLQGANGIICVSNALKDIVLRSTDYKGPIDFIHNPVPSRKKPEVKVFEQRKNTIIFVGRLHKVKGIAKAIRIFQAVSKEIQDARMNIVGSGPEEQRLKAMVAEMNMEDKVEFSGWSSSEELSTIRDNAKVSIMMSRSEGLSNTALESCACGLPQIVNKVGGLVEVVEHGLNGYLVDKDASIEDVADYVIRLMKDGDLWNQLSEGALSKADQFSVSCVGNKYAKFIQSVMFSTN